MFRSLMIHVLISLFKTFSFINMLYCNYASLNNTTKLINSNNSFWKSFQEFKRLLRIAVFKKEKALNFERAAVF